MKNSKDVLMKFISTQGYKRNSPDVNRPVNVIPSGRITMQDVDFPVRGVDNLGNEMFMMPGGEYFFPGDYVVETPMMQRGGQFTMEDLRQRALSQSAPIVDNTRIVSQKRIAKQKAENPTDIFPFFKNVSTETVIDQIPYGSVMMGAKALNQGRPWTALSEFAKVPLGWIGDAGINALQENPTKYSINALEDRLIPFVRLVKGANFGTGESIATQVGKQIMSSGEKPDSKWYARSFNLPGLYDAAKTYGVDNNTFTKFVEDNWENAGGDYNQILELAKTKLVKKQSGGKHGGLDRWFAEKWVDVKTGKECGRQEGEKRAGYPACRPSKRVSEDTPKTASELSSAEKEKFKRSKTSSERISYQHKRKQDGGEWLDKYENTKENRQKVDQLFGPPAAGNVDYVPAVESVVGGFSAGLAKSALAPVVKSNLQTLRKYMEMQDSPFTKIDLPTLNEAKNWLNNYDEGGATYTVKKGDTLSKIAAENKTTVNKIVQANNIKNPNIIGIDQKLVIPQGSSVNNAQTGSTEYVDWSEKKKNLDMLNNLPDEQLITGFYSDKPEQTYLVVDKKNAQMKVYKGDKVVKTYEVGVGANPGDAQTVTKVVNGKADWSAGNKSTGAGAYTISNIDPASKAYYGLPSFNLKNDSGIEVSTTIHGTPTGRRSRFDNDNVEDNRMSYGCINGKCFDLKDLQKHVDIETPVYVLPEDEGNRFQIVDGKPVLKVSAQNRAKYNSYVDAAGKVQKGQGANQSVNTLSYSPIKAVFDEKKFKEKVFSWNDLNDEKEYQQTTKPFYNALVKNKQSIMKNAKIPSDVYNELAQMAFGIYGTESNFGDTHSAVGNIARASAKFIDSKNSSSPDYKSKATTYGANEESRSVGLTQIRWNYLNEDEKQVLKSLGITSNMDFMDPEKAAIGTVALLGVRYNQQLTDNQKRDIWSHLPSKWNRRGNYGDRVKQNASYLNFKEATNKRQTGGQTNWLDNYND
jgi:murein DD-endopeptidase MepM/ murein hydrolase activator NlpD